MGNWKKIAQVMNAKRSQTEDTFHKMVNEMLNGKVNYWTTDLSVDGGMYSLACSANHWEQEKYAIDRRIITMFHQFSIDELLLLCVCNRIMINRLDRYGCEVRRYEILYEFNGKFVLTLYHRQNEIPQFDLLY